jgi:hypothetical protein
VYNPNRLAGSPTGTGTHICTNAGGSHNESLLPFSPHLSLEVGQSNAASCDTERTAYHHRKKKEFVSQTPSAHQSTGRTCTGLASIKLIIISITMKQSGSKNMNTSIKEIN